MLLKICASQIKFGLNLNFTFPLLALFSQLVTHPNLLLNSHIVVSLEFKVKMADHSRPIKTAFDIDEALVRNKK